MLRPTGKPDRSPHSPFLSAAGEAAFGAPAAAECGRLFLAAGGGLSSWPRTSQREGATGLPGARNTAMARPRSFAPRAKGEAWARRS